MGCHGPSMLGNCSMFGGSWFLGQSWFVGPDGPPRQSGVPFEWFVLLDQMPPSSSFNDSRQFGVPFTDPTKQLGFGTQIQGLHPERELLYNLPSFDPRSQTFAVEPYLRTGRKASRKKAEPGREHTYTHIHTYNYYIYLYIYSAL